MLFFERALEYLEKNSDELVPLTVRTYYWNLKKVDMFDPGLECENMTSETVCLFKHHLESLHNKEATIIKALSVFRIFCNKMKSEIRRGH